MSGPRTKTMKQREPDSGKGLRSSPSNFFTCILPLVFFLPLSQARAGGMIPPIGTNSPPTWLDSWSFNDTNNWTSDLQYAPVSFNNLDVSRLGQHSALLLDSTNAAWLQYNVIEPGDGHTNLTVGDQGAVMFWFAPTSWSGTNEGGTGPGQWGRLLEAGAYTEDASYGWWSLYVDPDGANLYFSAQTNGQTVSYLSAPIDWTTNRWHLIALTYSETNTALYVDAALLTNGPGMTVWPGPEVLTNGFWIGSDGNGSKQARGMYDQLATYNYPLESNAIRKVFSCNSAWYYLNPMNFANFASAPSTPQIAPVFNAVTGQGFLQDLGAASGCSTSGNVWMTNTVVTRQTNGSMNVTFTIAGGQDGLYYDVFANSVLDFSSNTNLAWAWMGQGIHCHTYMLTNLPSSAVFLVLGTPWDLDLDGLTDAYEKLVSKSAPAKADTNGDGLLDGWKVLWGLSLFSNNPEQAGQRFNFSYYPEDWLSGISGIRSESVGTDPEGNVTGN